MKTLHNNNPKELITCYKCSHKNHIKKNCLALKIKKLQLKLMNKISHQKFNTIRMKTIQKKLLVFLQTKHPMIMKPKICRS